MPHRRTPGRRVARFFRPGPQVRDTLAIAVSEVVPPAPDVAGFLAALEPAVRPRWAALPDLGARLAAVVEAARTDADSRVFLAYVAERIPAELEPDEVLASLRPGDLALARDCAAGVPGAIERFEAELFDEVDAAWARFRDPPLDRAELRQALRERLFVADERPARITGYQGRGALRAWVRMAATRHLLDQARARAVRPDRPGADAELAELATAGDDPELGFLKRTYRADFRAAFAEALAGLDARSRNLLRHRYLDGLDVAAMASIYGLHRVSMSRTLSRVRDDLHAGIRRAFMRRLGVDQAELDSILALIGSHLEVSLAGLLRSGDGA